MILLKGYEMKKVFAGWLMGCCGAAFAAEVVPLGTMDGFYRNTAVLDRTLVPASMMWEIPDWMAQTDFPYVKKPFGKELPFADACTVVRLLGGWMDSRQDPHRANDENDLAGRDENGNIFYRWDLLKARLDPYVEQGLELTLVLDNFPHCFPEAGAADSGKHFGQVTPPENIREWYDFIHAMCVEIKRLYGAELQQRLRFRMGTEMQDDRRFAGTFEEYCRVYDHAAAAVKAVFPDALFGPFNRSMPQGNFQSFGGLVSGNVGLLKLADHCASGTNTATGEIGSPFDFAPRSFYYFSSQEANGRLVNIQPDERLPEFRRMWDAIEAASPRYQGISKEVQEYGSHLNTEGGLYGLDTGARGAAQNLDTIVGMKEIGTDRIWHWELFEKIDKEKTLLMSQGWLYCIFERMRGGEISSLPVESAEEHGNRHKALLSVKDDEAVLVVSSWNPDRVQRLADQLTLSVPGKMKPVGMLSFSEENSVFDVIRDDLKAAGLLAEKHLKHRGEPATTILTKGYTSMAADPGQGKEFVSKHWKKYGELMTDSLMLKPFDGSVETGSGGTTIQINVANPSVTVVVFQ
jgi:hypothetical protein